MMASLFRQRPRLLPWVVVGGLALISMLLVVARWQGSPPGVFTLDLGNPATPAGHFYNAERSGDTGFRWSHDLSAVSLPALGTSQIITITATAPRPDPNTRVHFRLLRGTEALAEFDARPGWQSYSLPLAVGLYPDVRITIESDTFYPPNDNRRLGIAVASVSAEAKSGRFGFAIPPLLLVLLAGLLPLLTCAAGRFRSRRAAAAAGLVGALLPVAWASLAPIELVLPAIAWATGIVALVVFVYAAFRWSASGGWPVQWVQAVASSKWELPLVGIFHGVFAVVMTWPLATRLSNSLPGPPGEGFGFLYQIWWFRTSILHTHQWPLFDPNSYYPYGFDLARGEPTLLNSLPGTLLAAIFNEVAAYNLIVLASFVVAGIGSYLLVKELSESRSAGFLASVAFSFATYHVSQVGGHFQSVGVGWIPLAFYFVERALTGPGVKNGVLAGLMVAFTALTAWDYGYMLGLTAIVYLAIRLWTLRGEISFRALLRPALGAVVALGLLLGPLLIAYLASPDPYGLAGSAAGAGDTAASPVDYVLPNPLQPAWGETSTRLMAQRDPIDGPLYLGFVAVGIALISWLAWRRQEEEPAFKRLWLAWVAIGALAFVLSLGLTLHGLGGQVRMQGAGGTFPVPLPGRLLYDWLPFYSVLPDYAHFGVIVALAVSVLLGLGWAYLTRKGWARRHHQWLTLAVLCLLLVDLWTAPYKWGTSRVEPTHASQFIASLPAGPVMQMPLDSAQQGPALFASTYYNKPVAYGFGTYEPPEWQTLRPDLERFPGDAALDVLKQWGVRYVVVSANAYGPKWGDMQGTLNALPRLRHLEDFQETRLWDVDPGNLDARPDIDAYALPDTLAVYELLK